MQRGTFGWLVQGRFQAPLKSNLPKVFSAKMSISWGTKFSATECNFPECSKTLVLLKSLFTLPYLNYKIHIKGINQLNLAKAFIYVTNFTKSSVIGHIYFDTIFM